MLTAAERELLAGVDGAELDRHLEAITAFDRLGGSAGERQAAEYIRSELMRADIEARILCYPAILSNPCGCRLVYEEGGVWREAAAKARSFSASTSGQPVSGRLCYLPARLLPGDMLSFQLGLYDLPKLSGEIVLSEAAAPTAILACARQGAAGYVHIWNGPEELIHEGIFNPVWGTPLPGEDGLHPPIPAAAVSGPVGAVLKEAALRGAKAALATDLAERTDSIPAVEAIIRPATADTGKYLLIGNHLDSWHAGVTDNGTGNALALVLAKLLHRRRRDFKYGARVLWWSGHSNGRYAGSAAYARANFASLARECLAYMNIDMPGLRGATDYTQITAGMDLFALAKEAVFDVTGIDGGFCGPVRGWDQSFQNIGISPYFIWASALPPGHPDTTNNSFMSWWWHTEQDTKEYCDPAVLLKDMHLYLLAAWRLLTSDKMPLYDIGSLLSQAETELGRIVAAFGDVSSLAPCREALADAAAVLRLRESRREISLEAAIWTVRRLNRLLYAEKPAYLQDWAIEQGFFPGLRAAGLLKKGGLDNRREVMLRHYLECQANRILAICDELMAFWR